MNTDAPKKKKDRSKRRGGFILHWMVGTLASWIFGMILLFTLAIGIFLLIEGQAVSEDVGRSIIIYVLILPAGAMMGGTQQSVLKTYLGLTVKHWWWVTALSWSVGLFLAVNIGNILNTLLLTETTAPVWFTGIWIALMLTVPTGAQAWLLRRHLTGTWVYALAGIITGLICGAIMRDDSSNFWLFAPVIASGLSALTLMWLTSPTAGHIRIKRETAT